MDVLVGEALLNQGNMEHGRCHNHINLGLVKLELIDDPFDQLLGLLSSVVRFPVSPNKQPFAGEGEAPTERRNHISLDFKLFRCKGQFYYLFLLVVQQFPYGVYNHSIASLYCFFKFETPCRVVVEVKKKTLSSWLPKILLWRGCRTSSGVS